MTQDRLANILASAMSALLIGFLGGAFVSYALGLDLGHAFALMTGLSVLLTAGMKA